MSYYNSKQNFFTFGGMKIIVKSKILRTNTKTFQEHYLSHYMMLTKGLLTVSGHANSQTLLEAAVLAPVTVQTYNLTCPIT